MRSPTAPPTLTRIRGEAAAACQKSGKTYRVFERFFVEMEAKYPDAPDKLKFNEALKRMLNCFVTDLIENTHLRVAQSGIPVWKTCAHFPERLVLQPGVEQERREARHISTKHSIRASRCYRKGKKRRK